MKFNLVALLLCVINASCSPVASNGSGIQLGTSNTREPPPTKNNEEEQCEDKAPCTNDTTCHPKWMQNNCENQCTCTEGVSSCLPSCKRVELSDFEPCSHTGEACIQSCSNVDNHSDCEVSCQCKDGKSICDMRCDINCPSIIPVKFTCKHQPQAFGCSWSPNIACSCIDGEWACLF